MLQLAAGDPVFVAVDVDVDEDVDDEPDEPDAPSDVLVDEDDVDGAPVEAGDSWEPSVEGDEPLPRLSVR